MASPPGAARRSDLVLEVPLPAGVVVRRATMADIATMIDLAVEMVVHSISPYRNADIEGVQEYRRQDLQSLYDALAMPDAGLFVAEDEDGRIVGHVVVMAGRNESSTGEAQGWVFDLSVTTDHWGTGIADLLMGRAEVFVREKGLRYLGLGVTSANRRAIAFYERIGYSEERKQMIKVLEELP